MLSSRQICLHNTLLAIKPKSLTSPDKFYIIWQFCQRCCGGTHVSSFGELGSNLCTKYSLYQEYQRVCGSVQITRVAGGRGEREVHQYRDSIVSLNFRQCDINPVPKSGPERKIFRAPDHGHFLLVVMVSFCC